MTLNSTRVAVVLCARNEEECVESTMDAIFHSTRAPDEVVVADGLSEDGTVEALRQYSLRTGFEIKIVTNDSRWSGGGRNVAISQTTSDVIICGDFGDQFYEDYIELLAREFENDPDLMMAAGVASPKPQSDFEYCVSVVHYFDELVIDKLTDEERQRLLPRTLLPGGLCMAFRRSAWEKAGGFPEWLRRAQDKMFSRKVHAQGGRVALCWDARVAIEIRSSPYAVFRQLYNYGQGNGQSCYVNMLFVKLLLFYLLIVGLLVGSVFSSPWLLVVSAILFGAYAVKSGFKRLFAVGSPIKPIFILYIPVILVCRDVGSIFGNIRGWIDWIGNSRYRRLFRQYTTIEKANPVPLIAD